MYDSEPNARSITFTIINKQVTFFDLVDW